MDRTKLVGNIADTVFAALAVLFVGVMMGLALTVSWEFYLGVALGAFTAYHYVGLAVWRWTGKRFPSLAWWRKG